MHRPSVAVVEDDDDLAFTIRLNLEREGYSVSTFRNGNEALVAMQHSLFDLLVLDLNLPDVDGFTICRELRRNPSTASLPILMRGDLRDSPADLVVDSEPAAIPRPVATALLESRRLRRGSLWRISD